MALTQFEGQRAMFRKYLFTQWEIEVHSPNSQQWRTSWRTCTSTAPLPVMLTLLQAIVTKGTPYCTRREFRSAISEFHQGIERKSVDQHERVWRFMKRASSRQLLPSLGLGLALDRLRLPPCESYFIKICYFEILIMIFCIL